MMTTAPLPSDEHERLAVLHQLKLLDSPPEAAFDALTRLASTLLGTPIAVVSLIDASRQWFKSNIGLDVPETSREVAFCAHAILDDAPMVVPDAQQDERFVHNPLVTDSPHIRAYAGVPIRTSDGHAIGTLCVIDQKPRSFTPQEIALLTDLAAIVRREVLNRETALRAGQLADASLKTVSEQESLYHATFDRAAIGIAVVSLDGTWLRINPKLSDILGRPQAELLRITFQDITHPDDLSAELELVQQLLAGDFEHYSLEKRYLRPDDSVVWCNLTVTLLRDPAGQPLHFVAIIEDITARRAAEDALRQFQLELEARVIQRTAELQQANDFLADREADLQAVLTYAHDAYICIDEAGVIVEWNRQAEETFGWSRDEAIGQLLEDLIIPHALRDSHRNGMRHLAETGQGRVLNQRLELPAIKRDGSGIPCEVTITTLTSRSRGRVYAAFLHDISERKQAQQRLAEANQQQHLMLDNELFGIVKLKNRHCVWANRAFEQLFGYAPGELINQPSRLLYATQDEHERVGKEAYPTIVRGDLYRTEVEMVKKSGEHLWVDLNGALLSEETGESLWMFHDITHMKHYQRHVETMAFHDALTGLPNRMLLTDRLHQAVATAERTGDLVAICFADLDGFKAVNDTLGHDAGDELLRVIAQRLIACVRAHDTVARLGGDEFVLVLTQLKATTEAQVVLDRAHQAIAQPVTVSGGQPARVSSSFGVVYAPAMGRDPATLIAQADAEMYAAKRLRKASALPATRQDPADTDHLKYR